MFLQEAFTDVVCQAQRDLPRADLLGRTALLFTRLLQEEAGDQAAELDHIEVLMLTRIEALDLFGADHASSRSGPACGYGSRRCPQRVHRARARGSARRGLRRPGDGCHGFDRATRDLDLFVAPDAENVERLRTALASVYDDPEIASITADDLGGAYSAIQYGPPGVDFTVDIVSRQGDAYRFEDLEVERVQAGNVRLTVVTPETLFRMKRDTVRLRDRDDAQRLARTFGFGGVGGF